MSTQAPQAPPPEAPPGRHDDLAPFLEAHEGTPLYGLLAELAQHRDTLEDYRNAGATSEELMAEHLAGGDGDAINTRLTAALLTTANRIANALERSTEDGLISYQPDGSLGVTLGPAPLLAKLSAAVTATKRPAPPSQTGLALLERLVAAIEGSEAPRVSLEGEDGPVVPMIRLVYDELPHDAIEPLENMMGATVVCGDRGDDEHEAKNIVATMDHVRVDHLVRFLFDHPGGELRQRGPLDTFELVEDREGWLSTLVLGADGMALTPAMVEHLERLKSGGA